MSIGLIRCNRTIGLQQCLFVILVVVKDMYLFGFFTYPSLMCIFLVHLSCQHACMYRSPIICDSTVSNTARIGHPALHVCHFIINLSIGHDHLKTTRVLPGIEWFVSTMTDGQSLTYSLEEPGFNFSF